MKAISNYSETTMTAAALHTRRETREGIHCKAVKYEEFELRDISPSVGKGVFVRRAVRKGTSLPYIAKQITLDEYNKLVQISRANYCVKGNETLFSNLSFLFKVTYHLYVLLFHRRPQPCLQWRSITISRTYKGWNTHSRCFNGKLCEPR